MDRLSTRWILLCIILFTNSALADTPIDLAWLSAQTQTDGSLTTPTALSTPFQATSEALRTFYHLGQTVQPSIPAAYQFLVDDLFHNTETLSRKMIAAVNERWRCP